MLYLIFNRLYVIYSSIPLNFVPLKYRALYYQLLWDKIKY